MKMIQLLPVVALLACGCAQQPAANSAPSAAASSPAAQCAAGGLAPGSQAYGDCVNALAGGGAPAANAAQMQAGIQAQMDQQRAQMQQQMNQAQQNPACTTTRDANNNISTVCP